MLKYVSEDDYKDLLSAESVPNDFNNLVIEASSYINRQTSGRIDENNISKSVKYATCLIIQLISKTNIQKDEIGVLKSQNIEGWAETYKTDEEMDQKLEIDKFEILKNYLCDEIGMDGNPLLYRGV